MERDLGRVGRLACDKQHLVADHLDHLTVVAHHGRRGVLLEGFEQGGQVLDIRVPGRRRVPDDVSEPDRHGCRGQFAGRGQHDAVRRRAAFPRSVSGCPVHGRPSDARPAQQPLLPSMIRTIRPSRRASITADVQPPFTVTVCA
jgi:hypothetical protein